MKRTPTKTEQDFANIVKRKAWANNVRATTRGQPPGCVLINGKWLVGDYAVRGAKNAPRCDFWALVRDYGGIVRVEMHGSRDKPIKSMFYRLGRRGESVAK